jgi:hypothetical protein
MLDICTNFKINEEEYEMLDKQFGKLTWHAAHELKKKNTRNNHTDDVEDIKQELQISMIRAGSYYKRQVYIEKCLEAAVKFTKDPFVLQMVRELESLWMNRTRHGANKQKYGPYQEHLLEIIVNNYVPKDFIPNRNAPLNIDTKFATYCKAIVWNGQKNMGKKITREKTIRSGMVSLSEFNHMA